MHLVVYKPLSLTFGGGFENWLFTVGPELVQRHAVRLSIVGTTSNAGEAPRLPRSLVFEKLASAGMSYTEVPYFEIPVGRSPVPTALRPIAQLFEQADVVYFDNSYAFHDLVVAYFGWRYRVPVISGHHAALLHHSAIHNAYAKLVTRRLMRSFVASHVLNSDDKRLLESWGMQVHHIPIGLRTQLFRPEVFPSKGDTFRPLFVGRFDPVKGIDVLLKVIERGWKAGRWPSDLRFTIAGSGSFGDVDLKRLVAEGAPVDAVGYVQQPDLPQLYHQASLSVMPSRVETFGIVAAEAQLAGLPVLASDVPGVRDVVIHGKTGSLIANPDDLDAWENQILMYYRMWKDKPEQLTSMGRVASDLAVQRYGLQSVADQFYRMCADAAALKK